MRRVTAGLVGREAELANVQALLNESPLVTVTGVGGVGKTRLALAAAAAIGSDGDRQVDVCGLGELSDPAAVPFAVAGALGYPSQDAAVTGLGGDDRLLVVDCCEHVLDAAAATVARLVESCPGITVLATSREALDLPVERVLPLSALALPSDHDAADGSPAVQLFLARAVAVGASVSLDSDAETIVALCRRLDGLPLAIELAAARMRSLTPGEVLEHIDRKLGLLSRDASRGPQRHHSLEATIDWSYDRLPPPTQRFFDRIGVFSGRFTATAAHAVAGEPGTDLLGTVQLLDQLVTQSLVTTEQRAGRTWYGLLETLRSFARAKLVESGELAAVRDRWIDSVVATAVATRERMLQDWPVDLFVTLLNVHCDVDEALRWCIEHDDRPDRALRLFVPLCGLLKKRSAMPVADLGDRLLDRWPDEGTGRWAEAAAAASVAHVLRGSGERGAVLAHRAIGDSESGLAAVNARRALFFHDRMAGRDERALRWVDEAIEHAVAHDMGPWHNELLTFRAIALASLGRAEEAVVQVGAAYRAASRIGSPALEAWAGSIQACLIALRDPVAGRATLEQAAEYCEQVDYPIGAGVSLRALGALSLLSDRHAEAAGFLGRALEAYTGIGYDSEIRVTLRWIARLSLLAGRSADVAGLLWRTTGTARGDIVDDVLGPANLDTSLKLAAAAVTSATSELPLPTAVAMARRELDELVDSSGVPPSAADPEPGRADVATVRNAPANVFRLDGAVWTLSFAGATVRLPDVKGLHDLAVLLNRSGREVHCTELMGVVAEQHDTGPVLDERARREYKERVIVLQEELAEAEDAHDRGRAEKAALEMELLLSELTAASGLGGRPRRTGGTTDRARSAVTWRIRSALERIDAAHPALGAHLREAVQTGAWCAYRPDPSPAWEL